MQAAHRTMRVAAIAGAVLIAATVMGSAVAMAQSAAPEKKKLLIYDVQVAGGNNGFHAYLIRGADQAGKDLGIEVVSIFPDQPDLAQQLQKVEEAIVAQPDGIVVNCGLGPDDAYASVLQEAKDKGIPVGCSAAPPPGSGAAKTAGDPFLFRVGSQEDVAGQVTGQKLLELGAKGRVLIDQQQPQDVTCAARAKGEQDALAAAGVHRRHPDGQHGPRPGFGVHRAVPAREPGYDRDHVGLPDPRRHAGRQGAVGQRCPPAQRI